MRGKGESVSTAIEAIAREMCRVWYESESPTMDGKWAWDGLLNDHDRQAWLHLAAFVFSMVEQAKKQERSETRNDIAENGF